MLGALEHLEHLEIHLADSLQEPHWNLVGIQEQLFPMRNQAKCLASDGDSERTKAGPSKDGLAEGHMRFVGKGKATGGRQQLCPQ